MYDAAVPPPDEPVPTAVFEPAEPSRGTCVDREGTDGTLEDFRSDAFWSFEQFLRDREEISIFQPTRPQSTVISEEPLYIPPACVELERYTLFRNDNEEPQMLFVQERFDDASDVTVHMPSMSGQRVSWALEQSPLVPAGVRVVNLILLVDPVRLNDGTFLFIVRMTTEDDLGERAARDVLLLASRGDNGVRLRVLGTLELHTNWRYRDQLKLVATEGASAFLLDSGNALDVRLLRIRREDDGSFSITSVLEPSLHPADYGLAAQIDFVDDLLPERFAMRAEGGEVHVSVIGQLVGRESSHFRFGVVLSELDDGSFVAPWPLHDEDRPILRWQSDQPFWFVRGEASPMGTPWMLIRESRRCNGAQTEVRFELDLELCDPESESHEARFGTWRLDSIIPLPFGEDDHLGRRLHVQWAQRQDDLQGNDRLVVVSSYGQGPRDDRFEAQIDIRDPLVHLQNVPPFVHLDTWMHFRDPRVNNINVGIEGQYAVMDVPVILPDRLSVELMGRFRKTGPQPPEFRQHYFDRHEQDFLYQVVLDRSPAEQP